MAAKNDNQQVRKNKDTEQVRKNKDKQIDLTIKNIHKIYGKGAIMRLNDKVAENVPSIPTGSFGLDMALGIGGLPRGRIIEVYGPESSGKTTLALHSIAQIQKAGGIAAFVDAEHAFDAIYAENLGINLNDLLVSQPDYGEQALEITEHLIRSSAIDLVVIDSVAALVPKAELEGDMGDSKMGLQARLMSQALRKLTGIISKTNCSCLFINQLRDKIGVVYGNPETTTGGNALKFYSSVRLDIRRKATIKDGTDDPKGNRTRVKITKNKVAPPFREVEFDIIYGEGISRIGEIIDMATNYNIINKAGSWYSYGDQRIGQGRENVKTYLKEQPETLAKIEAAVKEAVREQGFKKKK